MVEVGIAATGGSMNDPGNHSYGEEASYKRYRPRMYLPRMSIFWWVKQKPYVLFIVRELTSLFIAAYMVLMMIQLNALLQGPQAWEALLASFATPLSITLHILIFLFVTFHSFTWFWIAPTAVKLRIGQKQVPDGAIIAGNLALWILLSLAILWIVLSA